MALASEIKLAFTENSVGVSGGCNVHSGQYAIADNGVINFGSFISTLIFCENDQDPLVITALTNSYRILSLGNNRFLFISADLTKLMVIEKIVPLESFAGNYTISVPKYPILQGY